MWVSASPAVTGRSRTDSANHGGGSVPDARTTKSVAFFDDPAMVQQTAPQRVGQEPQRRDSERAEPTAGSQTFRDRICFRVSLASTPRAAHHRRRPERS